jgi:hypothetical protein
MFLLRDSVTPWPVEVKSGLKAILDAELQDARRSRNHATAIPHFF